MYHIMYRQSMVWMRLVIYDRGNKGRRYEGDFERP